MTSTISIDKEDYNDGYYHISQDVNDYPDATIYIVWSPRGPGKTYSALRYPYHKFKTVYVKRTNDDVATICQESNSDDFDPSPFAPINRDFGTRVKPRLLKKGLGAFYDLDENNEPTGEVISFIASLNAMKQIKGMNLSEAEWFIFDEFIPQAGEVVKRAEGEMLLDLYETISRDRIKRGRKPLKLILFANAEQISTHITNALEVVDTMADIQAKGISKYYDEERGIFYHHILKGEYTINDNVGMNKAMRGTAWALKSYEGIFSKNDFSNIVDMGVKNMRCMYHLHYRMINDAYIYLNYKTGLYYMTNVKGNPISSYDLDRENEQKRFYFDHMVDLRDACIEDRFKFKKYSYYDLIINYRDFYDI